MKTSAGPDEVEPIAADRIRQRLRALTELDYAELRQGWSRAYGTAPPLRVRRELLILGIAWKIQEEAFGGLNATTRRRLAELGTSLSAHGDVARDRIARLKPGARLIREWHGTTHTVTVLEEGFDWQGRTWPSLTKIASAITGTRWSGPRFFGLRKPTDHA